MIAKKKKKKAKFSINKLVQQPEGLSHASKKRAACLHCGLYRRAKEEAFVVPRIDESWTGKLLLITEALAEEAYGVARKAWRIAGYDDGDVAFVSPIRCAAGVKPTMAQLRACRPFLLKVLEVLKPRNVLGLGATALRALTNKSDANLTKARGKEISI